MCVGHAVFFPKWMHLKVKSINILADITSTDIILVQEPMSLGSPGDRVHHWHSQEHSHGWCGSNLYQPKKRVQRQRFPKLYKETYQNPKAQVFRWSTSMFSRPKHTLNQ